LRVLESAESLEVLQLKMDQCFSFEIVAILFEDLDIQMNRSVGMEFLLYQLFLDEELRHLGEKGR
jgi:hypothetical protein